ncbi:tetratricopeptide repeat protein [Streptomyces sp. BV286]|uniref:tetratricopeptide repeat protein n=1 Tax=Streptomyces sp. BV286 TaxID=2849672 RepID=UPI001C2E42C8|nr:tetratricopeptide repeat protein [Streptomyces sp. BV286]MBV1936161.1 tetratricopeptide repeat protein [Streptomyces sp. BV286]
MYAKASAPEYQGALTTLSVNSSLVDVLAAGTEQLRAAERTGARAEAARSGLAVAEAHRRLGQVADADRAWKASYRAAREAGDTAAMAWALWSGGTLARQRGAFPLAWRLLGLAAELGEQGGDIVVRGYSLAGMAETGRIQGDYAAVGALHERLLAEARKRGEARHTVWALEGIAQMHRNTGSYDTAYAMFEEAAQIAGRADDRRGHAWALRGLADIVSVRDGDAGRALALLAEAEVSCREMNLTSALAYNHKMRGNVLYRAGRYAEARDVYTQALAEFRAMSEPRGEALSRLGLAKSLARLGRDLDETAAELADLAMDLERIGLRHAHRMVAQAQAEFGIETATRTPLSTGTGPSPADPVDAGSAASAVVTPAVVPSAAVTPAAVAPTLVACDAVSGADRADAKGRR